MPNGAEPIAARAPGMAPEAPRARLLLQFSFLSLRLLAEGGAAPEGCALYFKAWERSAVGLSRRALYESPHVRGSSSFVPLERLEYALELDPLRPEESLVELWFVLYREDRLRERVATVVLDVGSVLSGASPPLESLHFVPSEACFVGLESDVSVEVSVTWPCELTLFEREFIRMRSARYSSSRGHPSTASSSCPRVFHKNPSSSSSSAHRVSHKNPSSSSSAHRVTSSRGRAH